MKEQEKYLIEYDNFKRAKDIGIIFGPNDITMEQVNAFYEIELKRNELLRNKNGR